MTTTGTGAENSRPRQRRRWVRHLSLGGALLLVVSAALLAWLLLTVAGRDTVLARVQAFLPPGSLVWERADGVLYGPLTLYGVHYRHNGVELRAQRIVLEPALRPLLSRRLHLLSLEVDHATLDLAGDPTPPSWPGSLPKFAMPFPLSADRVQLRDLRVRHEGASVLVLSSASGVLELAPGLLALRDLVADSDRGALRGNARIEVERNYRTQISATANVVASTPGANGAELRLQADGDLDHFRLALDGNAPGPLALRLALDEGRTTPRWSLSVKAPRLDLAALMPDRPADSNYAISLQANGLGGHANVQGLVASGDRAITIAPSQLAYEQGVLQAQPLVLRLLDGELRLRGRADLRPDSPELNGVVDVAGLRWRAADGATPVAATGQLTLAGTIDAWQVGGALDLLRDRQQAKVDLSGHGDRAGIRFERLEARTPAGAMTATAQLHWSPQRDWTVDATLSGIDPGYFAPGYEGAVSGHLHTSGSLDGNDELSLQANVDALSGHLRGRRLAGHGTLDWTDAIGHTDFDLRIGASHVQAKGAFGRSLDLRARFEPLHLDDLLADAQGSLNGQLTLRGDVDAPAVDGHLQGVGLRWRSFGAAHVLLDGKLAANADGLLRVDADGVTGIPNLAQVHLRISGSARHPRVEGELSGNHGSLALNGSAERVGAAWNGHLASLRYAPVQGAAWTLVAPTSFRFQPPRTLHLAHTCLASSAGSVCADAEWPQRANLLARGLPLNLLDPWIAQPDFAVSAYGKVDLDAHVGPGAQGGWTGTAQLHSSEGGLRLEDAHSVLGFSNLVAQASLTGAHVQLQLDSDLGAGGAVHARVATGLDAGDALSGNIDFDVRDITWLELFSTDLAAPKGQFAGRIALGGSRGHPALSGHAALANLQAELPALGIAVQDGHVDLDAEPNGALRVRGSLRSGEGTLAIGGVLSWRDLEAPLTVTLKGQNVRIADTPELSAVVSPDLQLGYAAGTLTVRGKVDVPRASMNLERLDSTVTPSPDVVVLDPREKAPRHALAVAVDLALAMGADVQLKGFSLDGKLGGQLRVRRTPGNQMTATGALDVSGRYTAYGRRLEIVRGHLGYGGGGFDNPTLDLLAQHEFDEATVGVRVRGTALQPQTQIVSTPLMDPSNALAYLVIGRPLTTANTDEGRQIGAAAAALSVGGNLIGQKIGARLGLDSAGVSESRALGGTAFTVGRYISPRLLVSYGVSLVGTGEVVTLKYLLRHGLDIQVESGREDRASINWRVEK